MTNPDKTRQRQASPAKQLRDTQITAMAAQGESVSEIARTMGLSRQQVSVILNSDEKRALVTQAEDRLLKLLEKATNAMEDALDSSDEKIRLQAATTILSGMGPLKQRTENLHSHTHLVKKMSNDELLEAGREAIEVLAKAKSIKPDLATLEGSARDEEEEP